MSKKIYFIFHYSNGTSEKLDPKEWMNLRKLDLTKINGYVEFLEQSYDSNGHLDHTKHWYKNGEIHREDGPAMESNRDYWFIHNKDITKKVEDWFKEMNWNIFNRLDTDEKKTLFRLKFL